jgi:hypothetical protein
MNIGTEGQKEMRLSSYVTELQTLQPECLYIDTAAELGALNEVS